MTTQLSSWRQNKAGHLSAVTSDGRFTAKVVKDMVTQRSSGDGIRYAYRKNPDEDLYDIDVVYENAKRQLSETKSLTNDEQALFEALSLASIVYRPANRRMALRMTTTRDDLMFAEPNVDFWRATKPLAPLLPPLQSVSELVVE